MFLVKLGDERLSCINVFGGPPNHIPKLKINMIFGVGSKGAQERRGS
jgi:hypothetical protein